MMKTNNPIDSLFQQKLGEHKMEASEQVWENIAAQQAAPGKKLAPIFYLRAASLALLIGLSSLVYFNSNSERLMNLRIERDNANVPELTTKQNPAQAISTTLEGPETEPKQKDPKENPKNPTAKDPQSTPAKVSPKKARLIPVLKTFNADPLLALNETEAPGAEILGMEEPEHLTKQPGRLKIKVHIPEVKGYYGPDATEAESAELGQRLWAYATNQFDRIVTGERPTLPKANPEFSIPLPDFINRQFANSK